MKTFEYTVTDPVGIHARPAGLLVRELKGYPDVTVTLTAGERQVNALNLMALLGLGIGQGDKVSVRVEGEDEEKAAEAIRAFFQANL